LAVIDGNVVPIKSSLEVSGCHEVIHAGPEVFIELAVHMCPVIQEMPKVDPVCIAALADKFGGPIQLMEGLAPKSLIMPAIETACPDARMWAVIEKSAVDPVRNSPGDILHNEAADIVADQIHFREVEHVNELHDIFGLVSDFCNYSRIFIFSKAAKVRRDDVKPLRKDRYVLPARILEFRPSMQREGQRATAFTHAMHFQVWKRHMIVFASAHCLHL
jgi:hypothetical protein